MLGFKALLDRMQYGSLPVHVSSPVEHCLLMVSRSLLVQESDVPAGRAVDQESYCQIEHVAEAAFSDPFVELY